MAISPDIQNGPYTANGSVAAFPFSFTAVTGDEVAVDVDGVTISAALYTVDIGDNGGTVHFSSAPAAGAIVLLRSNPDYLQESIFENQGAYNLATVNRINKRQSVRALINHDMASRALKVPVGDPGLTIPGTEARKGRVLGFDGITGQPVPVAADSFTVTEEMQGLAAQAAASAGLTAADRVATVGDRTQTGLDRVATGVDRAATGAALSAANTARDIAIVAAAMAGDYPNSAAANVPRGLLQSSVGAITPGSGGANGTFNLAFWGGNFAIQPTGTFTVAGNVVTAVNITGPGLYIGNSPTLPTPSFAASSGLTGAAVSLTAQFLIPSGGGYWVQSSDNSQLIRYVNNAGTAALGSSLGLTIGPIIIAPALFGNNPANGTMAKWLSLVTAQGSTASATVQAALRDFEYKLKQLDALKYFIRIGVMLGNDAVAARVPFYQRPGIGAAFDTGAISSWTEASGLVGATLGTGIPLASAALNVSSTLLGCYNMADPNGAGSGYTVGNASQSWGLYPDVTGNPATTSAFLFAWDYAGRISGDTKRATTGPVSSGGICKGPMSGWRRPDGSGGIILCSYPLVDGNGAGLPSYYNPNITIAEPSGNIEIAALPTWPLGMYWIAEGSIPDGILEACHRIFHELMIYVGRGVSTEGY